MVRGEGGSCNDPMKLNSRHYQNAHPGPILNQHTNFHLPSPIAGGGAEEELCEEKLKKYRNTKKLF